jgi:uncharacterized membrane protein YhaH (DUF805 family)
MFLPPDTKSKTEWWIVMFLVNSMLGIRSGWGVAMFVLAVLLLIGWALVQLTLVTVKRLWDIYQQWGTLNTRSGKIAKGAAVALVVLWLVALILARNPDMLGKGFLLFSGSLFAFTIICEVIDWLEERKQKKQQPALPENVLLKDVISWHDEAEQIHDAL